MCHALIFTVKSIMILTNPHLKLHLTVGSLTLCRPIILFWRRMNSRNLFCLRLLRVWKWPPLLPLAPPHTYVWTFPSTCGADPLLALIVARQNELAPALWRLSGSPGVGCAVDRIYLQSFLTGGRSVGGLIMELSEGGGRAVNIWNGDYCSRIMASWKASIHLKKKTSFPSVQFYWTVAAVKMIKETGLEDFSQN